MTNFYGFEPREAERTEEEPCFLHLFSYPLIARKRNSL